jgi:hypothetical protein
MFPPGVEEPGGFMANLKSVRYNARRLYGAAAVM